MKVTSMNTFEDTTNMYLFNETEGIVELEKHEGVEDVYNGTDGNDRVATWFRTRGYRFNTFANKILSWVTFSGEKTPHKTQQKPDLHSFN